MTPQTGVVTKVPPHKVGKYATYYLSNLLSSIFSTYPISLEGATGWLRVGRLGSMSVLVPWASQAKDRQYSVTY
jgi:hypothetical protein